MKASQLLAWLMCLLLAFAAMLMATRNWLKIAMLEKRFDQVAAVATEQTAVLRDIRALLQKMEGGSAE